MTLESSRDVLLRPIACRLQFVNAPLRVIVNDRPLRQSLTGVGHYIRCLLLALEEFEPQIAARPFLHTHWSRRDWRKEPAAVDPAARSASRGAGWVRTARPGIGWSRWPWAARRVVQRVYGAALRRAARQYALYHEPNHIPIAADRPTVTTVHDLSVLVHPEWHPADRVRWYEREFAAGLARTTRFIAASEFTRREMITRLGVAADRIDVTYQAARPAFCTAPQEVGADAAFCRELGIAEGFYLYVGTLEPRKNVVGLVEAYAALPAALRRARPLVLAGGWGWRGELLRNRLAEPETRQCVRLLGYMADEQLARLYRRCVALVWPTYYEGFGLPPLEAMNCGAAVIASRVASIPEVVGNAGHLLNPDDAPAWTAAMHRVAEDDAWRRQLCNAGLEQAARFSWRACAAATASTYRLAVQSDRRGVRSES